MNDTEKSKIAAFLNDPIASQAVFKALVETFLTDGLFKDTNGIAAQTLAYQLLRRGWRDLEKYRPEQKKEEKVTHNIGL